MEIPLLIYAFLFTAGLLPFKCFYGNTTFDLRVFIYAHFFQKRNWGIKQGLCVLSFKLC